MLTTRRLNPSRGQSDITQRDHDWRRTFKYDGDFLFFLNRIQLELELPELIASHPRHRFVSSQDGHIDSSQVAPRAHATLRLPHEINASRSAVQAHIDQEIPRGIHHLAWRRLGRSDPGWYGFEKTVENQTRHRCRAGTPPAGLQKTVIPPYRTKSLVRWAVQSLLGSEIREVAPHAGYYRTLLTTFVEMSLHLRSRRGVFEPANKIDPIHKCEMIHIPYPTAKAPRLVSLATDQSDGRSTPPRLIRSRRPQENTSESKFFYPLQAETFPTSRNGAQK